MRCHPVPEVVEDVPDVTIPLAPLLVDEGEGAGESLPADGDMHTGISLWKPQVSPTTGNGSGWT